MDIEKLINGMSKEEKKIYLGTSASDYFYHVYKDGDSPLKEKLEKSDKLNEEEWKEVLEKLFLITTKALAEEERIFILDSLYYAICKILKTFSFKDSAFYNECLKYVYYLWGMRKEKSINKDLVRGLSILKYSHEEQDLDILLRQHEEAAIFRDLKAYLDQEYNASSVGFISSEQKMYANSMKRSFYREKDLSKKYYS